MYMDTKDLRGVRAESRGRSRREFSLSTELVGMSGELKWNSFVRQFDDRFSQLDRRYQKYGNRGVE